MYVKQCLTKNFLLFFLQWGKIYIYWIWWVCYDVRAFGNGDEGIENYAMTKRSLKVWLGFGWIGKFMYLTFDILDGLREGRQVIINEVIKKLVWYLKWKLINLNGKLLKSHQFALISIKDAKIFAELLMLIEQER